MIHLRGLIILSLFLSGDARRSFRIEDLRHDAQQQIKTLTKDFELSAAGKDALLPSGLKSTLLRKAKKVLPQRKALPRFPSAKMNLGYGPWRPGYDMGGWWEYDTDGYGRYGGYDMDRYGMYGRPGYDMGGYGMYGRRGYGMGGYGMYGRQGYDMDGYGMYGRPGYDMGGYGMYGRWGYDMDGYGRRSGMPYMSATNPKKAEIAENDAPNAGKVATAPAGVASGSAGGADD